jgi:single-stranded DNA-binding protein
MNPLNSVLIEGDVIEKPEIKKDAEGKKTCFFRIESNRTNKEDGATETCRLEIETNDEIAEKTKKICKVGDRVRVVGRIKQYTWIDAQAGQRSTTRILSEHVKVRPSVKKD